MTIKKTLLSCCLLLLTCSLIAQENPEKPEEDHSYKPLTLKLTPDGKKYIRFITWHQIWATTQNFAEDNSEFSITPSIRRSRFLAFAQVSPKFLILTHFGLNGLNASSMNTLGNRGDGSQLFLHGAWAEFKLNDEFYLGGGLHYWKGLNRMANASTLNFMTLDQSRPFIGWHSLGYTDQFARHMGIYAKGQVGKFDYRIAFNDPLTNSFEAGSSGVDQVLYNTAALAATGAVDAGEKKPVIEGYFRYNFWDKESTKLPYAVGTYLGKKKVFGIGAGFFSHANGTAALNSDSTTYTLHNVNHLSIDAFLDMPIGSEGNALNAYATYIDFDYGPNYAGLWGGTGGALYAQIGYYINSAKIMPYIGYQYRDYEKYDALEESKGSSINAGVNYYINGHNAKLTLEYHGIKNRPINGVTDVEQIRLQAHIFL